MRITRRGWAIAALGLVLYFFANQTQVGWLYVLSALALGLWLTVLALPGLMLRGLTASRRVNGSDSGADLELYAGQPVTIELTIANGSRLPALLLRGLERCPLAPPAARHQELFVPAAPARASVSLTIDTTCFRRGWYPFQPLRLETVAPFGFSRASRELPAHGPEGVLVFPEYRELERLELFDQRPAVETSTARAGLAGEFIGVRDYRPGDPRRSVHWRSTARAGRLIVKEFAEEVQPGLTIALDLRAGSALGPQGETLELAIKVAATLARYALNRNVPFSLVASSSRWPPPNGPLSWWGLISYLARVEAAGAEPLDLVLGALHAASCVAVILPAPDSDVLAPVIDLQRMGVSVMVVIVDPAAFVPGLAGHAGGIEARRLAAELESLGVAARLVGAEPDWERVVAS